MKKVKVQDAVGLTLCHDITAMRDGFKGAAFKRGHVIEEGDVEKLLDLGKRTVFIWEENAGEIHEEDAARRMAAMAQVEGCHYTEPSEGKVLLMADTRGMFRVDTALLNQVNSIGDLTISTLPDHFPVEAGDRLASMRIVPLVTQASVREKSCSISGPITRAERASSSPAPKSTRAGSKISSSRSCGQSSRTIRARSSA